MKAWAVVLIYVSSIQPTILPERYDVIECQRVARRWAARPQIKQALCAYDPAKVELTPE